MKFQDILATVAKPKATVFTAKSSVNVPGLMLSAKVVIPIHDLKYLEEKSLNSKHPGGYYGY